MMYKYINDMELDELLRAVEAIAEDNNLYISVKETGYCDGDHEVFIADKKTDENYFSSIFFFGDIEGLVEDICGVAEEFLDYLRDEAIIPEIIQRIEDFIEEMKSL